MRLSSILITGGARSGKSHYAQELALKSGREVLFVATAVAGDEEMRQRIEKHQRERPDGWRTLEVPTDVGSQILGDMGDAGTVIVDCVTLLVSNVLGEYCDEAGENIDVPLVEREVFEEIGMLVETISRTDADFIVVTNEVGLGLVPANWMGRLYRDLLGKANQLLAQEVDEVYLMVSGLPLQIKPAR